MPINSYIFGPLKMNHMFNIIQGISPAYLREDILLSDNSNYQTRSVTSPSCQIPRVNSSGLKIFLFYCYLVLEFTPFLCKKY